MTRRYQGLCLERISTGYKGFHGKIMSDRPITALEAIMEAGGFDYTKANLKAVTVIRTENGKTEHHKLNHHG